MHRTTHYLRLLLLAALSVMLLSIQAQAQSDLRIYGSLSNFDCYNDSDNECEGFEIEIEDIHKEDVIHTYAGSAFGAPTVTDISTSTKDITLVRYHSTTATVQPGRYTHFGVTISGSKSPGAIRRRWLPKGPVPPKPVPLPRHQALLVNIGGQEVVRNAIINDQPDGGITFWILPFANRVPRTVELEELMTDNPLVTDSIPLGGGPDGLDPERLDPGDVWYNDDAPGTEGTESDICSYEVYEDVVTYPGGVETHAPGRLLATIMDATITVPVPVTVSTLTVSATSLMGGKSATGTVTLSGNAPAGGVVVSLTSDNPAVTVPATVTVRAGTAAAHFTVRTTPVAVSAAATLTAAAGGATAQAILTVQPPAVKALSVKPRAVVGGSSATGTVTLNGAAPAGGMVVDLASDSSLAQVPATVTVPAGARKTTFPITTSTVSAITRATIQATASGMSKSATLKIKP